MKISLLNIPWYNENNDNLWGVRAGSRWPHFQKKQSKEKLPRYIPFPFFMAIAARILQLNKHKVQLIDGVAEGIKLSRLYEKLIDFSPEFIFIETSTPSIDYDIGVLKKIKTLLPTTILTAGGCHPHHDVVKKIQEGKIPDYWLIGEYEETLPALVETLSMSSKTINEPYIITNGNTNAPAFPPVIDPNKLPSPLFEQLPIQNYSDPVCGLPAPGAQSWLSRGCPFKCTFCVWPQLIYGNRKYRTRDIDKALDEIEVLINDYGCKSFYFDDDTTNIGEKRIIKLAHKIKKRGLDKYPWSMMARADCMTDSMLLHLKDACIYSIKYGVESISEQLLNSCSKKTRLDKLLSAIKKTKELDIKLHLTFTLGIPGETTQTIKDTLNFAISTAPHSAQFSLCTPFPGTSFFNECVQNNWLVSHDFKDFLGNENTVISTKYISAKELQNSYEYVLAEWKKFNSKRNINREKKLIKEIKNLIKKGKNWSFYGDENYEKNLKNIEELSKNFIDKKKLSEKSNVIAVIKSKSEEEKIYRSLLGENDQFYSYIKFYSL